MATTRELADNVRQMGGELAGRIDDLRRDGHLDDQAATALSGIGEWFASFEEALRACDGVPPPGRQGGETLHYMVWTPRNGPVSVREFVMAEGARPELAVLLELLEIDGEDFNPDRDAIEVVAADDWHDRPSYAEAAAELAARRDDDTDTDEDAEDAHEVCYYADPATCRGGTWACQTCGETYCDEHWHETDKGRNVECVACEGRRRELGGTAAATPPPTPLQACRGFAGLPGHVRGGLLDFLVRRRRPETLESLLEAGYWALAGTRGFGPGRLAAVRRFVEANGYRFGREDGDADQA